MNFACSRTVMVFVPSIGKNDSNAHHHSLRRDFSRRPPPTTQTHNQPATPPPPERTTPPACALINGLTLTKAPRTHTSSPYTGHAVPPGPWPWSPATAILAPHRHSGALTCAQHCLAGTHPSRRKPLSMWAALAAQASASRSAPGLRTLSPGHPYPPTPPPAL